MIGDTIGITYNAVAKTLSKVNQDNYGADYYLDDSANLMRFFVKIRHTIPGKNKVGESHMMRLDAETYDASGVLLRTTSSWNVLATSDGIQDFTTSKRLQAALLTAATVTNTDKLLGRES